MNASPLYLIVIGALSAALSLFGFWLVSPGCYSRLLNRTGKRPGYVPEPVTRKDTFR